jgi:hypothetical protein
MENYAQSYSSGASENSTTTSPSTIWPGSFDDTPLDKSQQSLLDYNEENYFKTKF